MPSLASRTGSPLSTMMSATRPSPVNKSHRCHSEVMPVSASGSSRAHRMVLFNVSAYRNSAWHSREASQCFDSKQITASQRLLARCNACLQRSPGRIPVCGSRSRKISSARPGSCSINHALTAVASRLSRLEWLKNTRDTLHPRSAQARTYLSHDRS